ncbi:MAG: MBL fold metallo-hydrolase [Verrucomicrobiales bacterium]|nr:MBL fold metallo-hydrolase [Verrucomicrobiales bacterium]
MIIPVQKDLELVEDFHSADSVTGALHVWWLGHSGFLLKWNGVGIMIDPYLSDSMAIQFNGRGRGWPRMTERVVDPLIMSGVDLLLTTNNHLSHLDPETILGLRAASPNMKMVVPAGSCHEVDELLGSAGPHILPVDAGCFVDDGEVTIHGITAANPDIQKDEKGASKSLGYVLTMGPFAIYHSGDTLWHKSLVKEVRRWNLNLAMLPISGYHPDEGPGMSANLNGFEASALAKAVSAGLVVPSHYDMFADDTAPTDEFIYCCDRLEQKYRILQPGIRLTMGPMIDPGSGKALPTEAHSSDWGLGY